MPLNNNSPKLCTASDNSMLAAIGFVAHYNDGNNRTDYRLEGKYVYFALWSALSQTGVALKPEDLVDALSARLRACPLFIKWMRHKRPLVSSLLYDLWTTPAARYMLDEDWIEIS